MLSRYGVVTVGQGFALRLIVNLNSGTLARALS